MALVSFLAGESISAGNAVYVSSSGLLFKASANTLEQAIFAGFATEAGSTNDLVRVLTGSQYTGLSGLTPGNRVYLGFTPGSIESNYNTWAIQAIATSGTVYQTEVGVAISTSGVSNNRRGPLAIKL
jgi:hypothetical protein